MFGDVKSGGPYIEADATRNSVIVRGTSAMERLFGSDAMLIERTFDVKRRADPRPAPCHLACHDRRRRPECDGALGGGEHQELFALLEILDRQNVRDFFLVLERQQVRELQVTLATLAEQFRALQDALGVKE